MRKVWLLLCFTCALQLASAQRLKVEREYRTFPDLVPKEAREWMDDVYKGVKKVKWYYQEDQDDEESYEARFRLNRLRHAITFDDDGDVEDIQIQRSLKELPAAIRNRLQATFDSIDRFRLKTLEEQWTAKDDDDLTDAARSGDPADIQVRYEVEFRARIDGIEARWEALFNPDGKMLSKNIIYPPYR
ncbi:MAG: hypothetical protein Roseis2KO_02620 [Roseivirga sp.]